MNSEEKEDLIRKIVNGEVAIHQIEKFAEPNDAVEVRRRSLEIITKSTLENIGSSKMDYSAIRGKNAENVIGAISVPVGVVGPIKVKGGSFDGSVYVPMATTEGALIASIGRGIKAINLSGGAVARVIDDGMTRGPVFKFDSIVDAHRFVKWLHENFPKIKAVAEATTHHGKLERITHYITGNNVFLRLRYKTGDAMGMNMATVATEAACTYMEKNFKGATLVGVSGNMCSDKKPSMVNMLEGRGKTVIAEIVVKGKVLKDVFGADAATINDINFRKNWAGSIRAGSATHLNAHFANMVAAIFLATGQDIAQVVESSSGYTWTELRGRDLYISVTMPSLEIGTKGGGTGLPTQNESLSIMKLNGSGEPLGSNSMKLAEVIASIVMAGELNLLSALATRDLGKAHQKLGRSK